MGFTIEPDLIYEAKSDRNALERLLTALWPEAYRVAFGVLSDRGIAEDAAQEACASIALALPSLRSTDAFYGWMYRIIVRHATLAAKRWKRSLDLDVPTEPQARSNDAERLDLIDALAALPLSQRTAVILHYYAGYNSIEIARMLAMPAPTVRFHLMLARRALRAALAVIDSSKATNVEVYQHAR